MTFSHQGAFDGSAILDLLSTTLEAQFNTIATQNFTIPANVMSGAGTTVLGCTANGANAVTTRTAAQIYADLQALMGVAPPIGFSWLFRIVNTGNNTVTLTAGAGVTINGTATAATNTFRDWIVTITSPTTLTIQSVGTGTAP